MDEFQWDESMNIGVKEVDDQHAYMTGVLNTLCQAYAKGKDKEVIEGVIAKINDYAHYHFQTEERIMEPYADRYEDYSAHLAEHQFFFDKVVTFLLDYVDGKSSISIDLLNFLVDWWFQHINGMDKGLGTFLAQQDAQ